MSNIILSPLLYTIKQIEKKIDTIVVFVRTQSAHSAIACKPITAKFQPGRPSSGQASSGALSSREDRDKNSILRGLAAAAPSLGLITNYVDSKIKSL